MKNIYKIPAKDKNLQSLPKDQFSAYIDLCRLDVSFDSPLDESDFLNFGMDLLHMTSEDNKMRLDIEQIDTEIKAHPEFQPSKVSISKLELRNENVQDFSSNIQLFNVIHSMILFIHIFRLRPTRCKLLHI